MLLKATMMSPDDDDDDQKKHIILASHQSCRSYNATTTSSSIPPHNTITISLFFSVLFALILIHQSIRFQHDFAALQYSTKRPGGALLLLNDHYAEYLQQSKRSPSESLLPIQWRNRNYMTHPVTLAESNYLHAMAAEHARKLNRTSVIKAAICHPTIFDPTAGGGGRLNNLLDPFFAWVSYYRLLGFQHVFLWYEGHVNELPRFDELAALPYVTLTRYIPNGEHLRYHGQGHVERQCMSQSRFAANYSWALPLDVDEYLWLGGAGAGGGDNNNNNNKRRQRPQSIQDFLSYYEAQNYTYISLGKYHYSTLHVYNVNHEDDENGAAAAGSTSSPFGLEKWPFTPGPYCFGKGGMSSCPTWMGRCKVFAKPSKFDTVEIHGTKDYHLEPDGIHLDTSVAHFKEWSRLLVPPNASVTVHHSDTQSFHVTDYEQTLIAHVMKAHKKNVFGQVKMDFDPTLQDWFQFVAQGCPSNYTSRTSPKS